MEKYLELLEQILEKAKQRNDKEEIQLVQAELIKERLNIIEQTL